MPQMPVKNKFKSRFSLYLGGLFFVALALGLCILGTWQLHRAVEKEQHIATSRTFLSLPRQEFIPGGAYPEWQRVIAEGRFDTSREVVLESQLNQNEEPGYRIVTPLVIGPFEVLVDRGWIPRDFTPGFLQKYAPQHNQFTAVVRRFPARHGWLQGPTENYGAAHTLVFFDPAEIPLKPGIERLGYYLQADSKTHEQVAAFITTPAETITPERHRQYAFTWFSCAALWLACGVYYAFSVLRVREVSGKSASGQKAPKAATRRGK
jgi:cytochrome oxidase assembly protein ShyY1